MPNLGRMGILCRKVSNLIREDWLYSAEANVHAEADSAIDVENEDSERLVARTVRFGAEADRVIFVQLDALETMLYGSELLSLLIPDCSVAGATVE